MLANIKKKKKNPAIKKLPERLKKKKFSKDEKKND